MNRTRKQNELYHEQKYLRDINMFEGTYEKQQEVRKEQNRLYQKYLFYQNLNEAIERNKMKTRKELGQKCKEIRQEARYSVQKWADELGLKKKQIQDFEKGLTTIPTLVLQEYARLKSENNNRKRKKKS